LDYIQGAGILNAVSAYEHLVAGIQTPGEVSTIGWDLNRLENNNSSGNIYKITVPEPADKCITATLVWNRHYSKAYPFRPLHEQDSNLRLEIWAVDPNEPANSYLLDYSDSTIDNIEHIYSPLDAAFTNYEIIMSANDTNGESRKPVAQQYSLAWNVGLKQERENILWYDLNADGIVNDLDLTIILNNLRDSGKSSESYLIGDINPDGAIDVNDLKALWDHNNMQADWQNN